MESKNRMKNGSKNKKGECTFAVCGKAWNVFLYKSIDLSLNEISVIIP